MELILLRQYHQSGTNGRLMLGDKELCKTIELPWMDNKVQRSCIPEGSYKLVKRYSERFHWHFELLNVPGRSAILIHSANWALQELKGCIAPVIRIDGIGIGSYSKRAFLKIKKILYPLYDQHQIITLTIKRSTL